MPLRFFIVAAITFPVVDMILSYRIMERLGFFSSALIIMGTAILGVAAASKRAMVALAKAGESMREGRAPTLLLGGALGAIVAGALLVLPGFIGDILGAGWLGILAARSAEGSSGSRHGGEAGTVRRGRRSVRRTEPRHASRRSPRVVDTEGFTVR